MDDRLPEPLFDELYLNMFVDAHHGYDKLTGMSITGLLSMVVWTLEPNYSIEKVCRISSYIEIPPTIYRCQVQKAIIHIFEQHNLVLKWKQYWDIIE